MRTMMLAGFRHAHRWRNGPRGRTANRSRTIRHSSGGCGETSGDYSARRQAEVERQYAMPDADHVRDGGGGRRRRR